MLVNHYGQNDWKFLASHFPVSNPMPSWESQCWHVPASPCAVGVSFPVSVQWDSVLTSQLQAVKLGGRPSSCTEGFPGQARLNWGEKLRFLSLCPVPWGQDLHMNSVGQSVCMGTAVTFGASGASGLTQGCPHSCSQNRSDQQCQYRWLRVLNPDLVKGPWTKEEDQKVRAERIRVLDCLCLQGGWGCQTHQGL